jgi:hypothetical protein
MIVNRRTFIVKKGKMDEVVALLVNIQPGTNYRSRIYSSMFGPFDTIAVEIEARDMDEYNRIFAQASSEPGWADFIARFDALTVPGGSNEMWVLAE